MQKMARTFSHANKERHLKKTKQNYDLVIKHGGTSHRHFRCACYKMTLSELEFPDSTHQHSNTINMVRGRGSAASQIHIHTDRSTVKSISDVEHTTFSLIFQIQWKHPYDSLPWLILNTFPLSLSSQKDVYERPQYL